MKELERDKTRKNGECNSRKRRVLHGNYYQLTGEIFSTPHSFGVKSKIIPSPPWG